MKYLKEIYTQLISSDIPLWKYCLIAYIVALLPSVLLLNIESLVLSFFKIKLTMPPLHESTWKTFVKGSLIGPVIESLLLILTIKCIKKFITINFKIAIIAGIIWGLLHGVASPFWIGNTAWYFFIFSIAYCTWLPKSASKAYIATTIPHIMINISAFTYNLFF